MNEPNYPNNSIKFREAQKTAETEKKQIRKVTKGPVRTKRNNARKIADIFISEDISSVKHHVFMDVLVPAVKKAVYDIVTTGIDLFLYGGSGKAKSGSNATKVSYRNYYDQKNSSTNRSSEPMKPRDAFDFDNIVFNTRGEAEDAKQQLLDILGKYGMASVNDLYEMTPLTPPYTAANFGWHNGICIEVDRVHDGYILKLPRAVPLER